MLSRSDAVSTAVDWKREHAIRQFIARQRRQPLDTNEGALQDAVTFLLRRLDQTRALIPK